MRYPAIDALALANRPSQFALLESAADVFTAGSAVTHLYVRGSLASGTADRLSDLDFIIGIADAHFPEFVHVCGALMINEFNAVLPGWRDTIVADLGGLGYVYLVECDGKLQQIDLYLVPASRAGAVQQRTGAACVYTKPDHPEGPTDPRVNDFIAVELARPRGCTELLIEVLVLGLMIRKRIVRGQRYIAYAETYLLNTAVKDLIKAALAPTSTFYGWYHLTEDLGSTPIGRACLRDLSELITGPPIHNVDTLDDAIDRVVNLAERAAPESVESLREAIAAYRHYLELT